MVVETSKLSSEGALQKYIQYLLRKKKGAGDDSPERVLLVSADNILCSLTGISASSYAKKMSGGVSDWNSRFRLNKSLPKSPAQSVVISFFPGSDSERKDNVTECESVDIAREMIGMVAPGDRVVSYVVHGDTEHLHVHAVFSSVCSKGKIWNPRHDFRLWEYAASKLEAKYGLYVTPNRIMFNGQIDDVTIDGPVVQKERRTGAASEKRKLKIAVEKILNIENLRFSDFVSESGKNGISIILNRASTGTITGMSLRLGTGPLFKASDLNRAWSWNRLSERLQYDLVADHRLVLQLEALKPKVVKMEIREASSFNQSVLQQRVYALGAPVRKRGSELKRFRWEIDSSGARHYYWRSQKRPRAPIFSDFGDVLLAHGFANNFTFAAMAELAKAKGWTAVEIFASDPQTATRLWFECVLQGVEVVNFTPDENALVRLLSEEFQPPVLPQTPSKQLSEEGS